MNWLSGVTLSKRQILMVLECRASLHRGRPQPGPLGLCQVSGGKKNPAETLLKMEAEAVSQ